MRTLQAAVEAYASELSVVREVVQAARERELELERAYTGLVISLATKIPAQPPPDAEAPGPQAQADAAENDRAFDYAPFAYEFGAAEDLLRQLYASYVSCFRGARHVLDVGCGRGAFLSALRDEGIGAYGIDTDEHLIRVCLGRGLDARCVDAIDHLSSLPDESLDGIFAGHLIEHLNVARKGRFFQLCHDKLREGGHLIAETPNTKSAWVMSDGYFRDPTHAMPLHPETYRFLALVGGFRFAELRSGYPVPQEMKLQLLDAAELNGFPANVLNENFQRLNAFLYGDHNVTIVATK